MSNISDFSNTSNYLPIFNAVVITDMIVILLSIFKIINSSVLKQWYRSFNLSAVICDVLIIIIGIIITRFLYPYFFKEYSLMNFIILAVIVQIVHDLLFYKLFMSIPKGSNQMLDVFRDYGKEVGFNAVIADSAMMILSCVLTSYLVNKSLNFNIIVSIISIYIIPYLIYNN
jgi:hypothetical protein